MDFAAIIVAAGTGSRAGGAPKQWRVLNGRAVTRWSVGAFVAAGASPIVVVIGAGQRAMAEQALAGTGAVLVEGGATRTASVQAGLAMVGHTEAVMIHDAARPLLSVSHIEALLGALETADGAIPALPVADTLKREDVSGAVTVDREGLWRAQTPQAFRRAKLTAAYAAWPGDAPATDDAAVVEATGGRVALIPGDPLLMKITHPEDFAMIERLAGGARLTRVGQGFDAHRFGPGDGVWLCGVKIAHDLTLIGHSDADAGLHALTDAILGAIGAGDIGDHFPPSDPQWKGASSDRFLQHAMGLVAERGGQVTGLDVTLICEQPRIKPHREVMRARLAEITALPLDRISVKATTTEGMGFTGRSEGLAAQAIATVEMPV
ncbi:MAG: bifunctional 2-C-methyl-D-erythritol 4-phosphate cytidylyltransferase/2-C-methyl-D-erythritol 2,4-cyclodiphosphate synthase [Pseudomonadota bacterium]|nr:bifunctional 2-C-methyl-D-erythritol 4-phosphate cytidylyltransferase/2-C-methyl-D-erythritol 2,4-cyclodiphosphate synthase [Pseudomonadota bacterium]